MATHIYEVAGGYHAEDDHLQIACFGHDAEEARLALQASRERAARIEARFAALLEVDEQLSGGDLSAIAESEAEFAQGSFAS